MSEMDRLESVFGDAFSVQLPLELWIVVLSQIRPDPKLFERDHVTARLDIDQNKSYRDEVLRNVSLTSRFLHDLALPIRFRHVELHADGDDGAKPTELYSRLSKSGSLRNMVQIVSVWVYGTSVSRLPDSAQDIVCGMHNLQEIRLETPFQMTIPLYSHICSLTSLQRLEVTTLDRHAPDIIDITPNISSQLSVNSLLVRCRRTKLGYRKSDRTCWCPYWARVVPSPWITYVALSPGIRHLRLKGHAMILPSIGDTLTIAPPTPHLITLEVTSPRTMREWGEFCQFISLTPLISTLIFGHEAWIFHGPVPDLPLPSKLLPALRHFEGVLQYANLIVPGRPVDAVVLIPVASREISDDLHALTLSTATVRSVDIRAPKALTCIPTMVELFPDLEDFSLMVSLSVDAANAQEWLQHDFASYIGRLRKLRTLGLNFHNNITVEDEKDALSRLPEDHSLERALFLRCFHRWSCDCPDVFWQKQSGVWTKS